MRPVDNPADEFARALARLRSAMVRPEFLVEEGPAPQRLAPHAVALTAEMSDIEDDRASGRFVLLHDPDGVDEWDGCFRAVVFARAELEADVAGDPMLREVAWTWVCEALAAQHAEVSHLGGTITVTSGESFGTMSDRPAECFVEIRASWTPMETEGADAADTMDRQLAAWVEIMSTAAGLTPVVADHPNVVPARRRGRL